MKKILYTLVFLVMLIASIYTVYNPEIRNSVSELANKFTDKQQTEVSKEEIIKLAKDNMQTFALAVKKKDMSGFYNTLSKYWQKRTSAKKLNKDFEVFIKREIDLTTLNSMQPVINKGTKVDEKGDLHIVGHYNTKPLTLHFNQIYQPQLDGWKLVAFSVDIK